MGLNDDIDDGLPDVQEGGPDLNPNQPTPEKSLFVPQLENSDPKDFVEPTNEELFGIGVVKNEVPNINAEFTLLKDNYNKANDLLNVREDVTNSNGISREDAEVIDSITPGFINDKKPLGFFTEDKSRTQLNESVNTINKTIDFQYATIYENLQKQIDKYHALLSPVIINMETKLIDSAISLQKEISAIAESVNVEDVGKFETVKRFLGRDITASNLSDDELTDPVIKSILDRMDTFTRTNRNKSTLRSLLAYGQSIISDVLFNTANYNHNSYARVIDEHPYLELINIDYELIDRGIVGNQLLALCLDNKAIEYIRTLIGASRNMLNSIVTRKGDIDNINVSRQMLKAKLDYMVAVGGNITKDYLNIIYILTFIVDYLDFVKDLAKVVKLMVVKNDTNIVKT
jgi:hypothetical protein